MKDFPNVHFGKVREEDIDWRNMPEDIDPDDELLDKTPDDVIGMLGFDPREFLEEAKGLKGGSGSGNYGHSGRPGEVGGSGEGGGSEPTRVTMTMSDRDKANLKKMGVSEKDFTKFGSIVKGAAKCEVHVEYYKGKLSVSADWSNKRGDAIAGASFRANNETKDLHLNSCILSKSEQGKGDGHAVLKEIEALGKKLGMEQVSLMANISVGTYAWARMGFDFETKGMLDYHKEQLKSFVDNTARINGMRISMGAVNRSVDKIKSASDLAVFTLKDFSFTAKGYGFATGAVSSDVPEKLAMHIGKAYLLGEVSQWNGVRKL
jgi:hypothetical protein